MIENGRAAARLEERRISGTKRLFLSRSDRCFRKLLPHMHTHTHTQTNTYDRSKQNSFHKFKMCVHIFNNLRGLIKNIHPAKE